MCSVEPMPESRSSSGSGGAVGSSQQSERPHGGGCSDVGLSDARSGCRRSLAIADQADDLYELLTGRAARHVVITSNRTPPPTAKRLASSPATSIAVTTAASPPC